VSHTIELKKVSKYYASEESVSMGFSRLDLELDMGEFVAITGESGSGKSTLLNVISGLDTYEEGEMFVCGEDTAAYNIQDYEDYRKTYIGNIFQDFNLVNSYTVYQNIELVMLMCGWKKKEVKARVNELIELVGLTQYARTKASKLSGGQKQRVAIARALAKNAPIIVADEPTGNLDSESAAAVMETLAKVSADKLVVVVTHNYEQAEPYVTRKITMHDGKIIEDKRIRASRAKEDKVITVNYYNEFVLNEQNEEIKTKTKKKPAAELDYSQFGNMKKGSELRLGIRNTFNIPSKFILLFIVYLFVASAVIGQYSSVKNNLNQESLMGMNVFFTNIDTDRLVLTKKDGSTFSDKDIEKIKKIDNIDKVVKTDVFLDEYVDLILSESYVEGPVLSASELDAADLRYGALPKNSKEVVIKYNYSSDAYTTIDKLGEDIIGKKVYINNFNGEHYGTSKYTICGTILEETVDLDSNSTMVSYMYLNDDACKAMLSDYVSSNAKVWITFKKTIIEYNMDREVYQNENVPEGQIYISEDQEMYFEGAVIGGYVNIEASNSFFKENREFKVARVLKESNFEAATGLSKESYSLYSGKVFINPNDYKALFQKGYYQVSAFVDNENKIDETSAALRGSGFKTLVIKDTLSDPTGGFGFVLQILSFGLLILELIVLFFISFAVIKLIMRSRNSYYSTLRILGASKKNTDIILRVELILMMVIAYIVDIAFVLLVHYNYIDIKAIKQQLSFIKPSDYVILAAVLLVMSFLIAFRYSRKIFAKSAMKTYREEA